MSFAIFKGETSVKDLVSRLFGISGKGSQAKADQAAKALLQANPQLQDISKVPVGTVINVPATAPPLKPAEAVPATVTSRMTIATQTQQTLDLLNQRLAEIDTQAADSANAFLALAQSQQVQSTAQSSAGLKEQLPNLIATAQAVVKAAKANQESRTQALSGVQARLQAFAQSKR